MINVFDRVRYPGQVYAQTHPSTIGATATLVGRKVRPFSAARVLEIGCGEGVNLINMALGTSGAEFVGVDLAGTAIAAARETAAACGLANVAFHALDLVEIDDAFGDFDVIVAHGVYTWTPVPVRAALMRVIGERLKPDGLAFVSFNVHPGSRLRLAVRDMALAAAEGVDEPKAQLDLVRAFLAEQIEAWSDTEPDQAAIKDVAIGMLSKAPGVLLHDELAPHYAPELLAEVVRRAEAAGLAYLCDAQPNVSAEGFFPTDAAAALRARAGDDWTLFEQLSDFRDLRPFRNAIFARGGAADWRRDPARLRGLWASGDLRIEEADAGAPDGARFVSAGGAELETNNARLAALFVRLAEAFPCAIPLDLGPEIAGFADYLVRLFVSQVIQLRAGPPPLVARAGSRPEMSPLARIQAARGETNLPTLRHTRARIEEPAELALAGLMDGTRTRAELAEALERLSGASPGLAARRLDEALANFSRLGLMAG